MNWALDSWKFVRDIFSIKVHSLNSDESVEILELSFPITKLPEVCFNAIKRINNKDIEDILFNRVKASSCKAFARHSVGFNFVDFNQVKLIVCYLRDSRRSIAFEFLARHKKHKM